MVQIKHFTLKELKKNPLLYKEVKNYSLPGGRFRANYLWDKNIDLLLLYKNGNVIAVAQIEKWKHGSYLFGVYVRPQWRRQKIGEQLLRRAKKRYKNIKVMAKDNQAKKFFGKFQEELKIRIEKT